MHQTRSAILPRSPVAGIVWQTRELRDIRFMIVKASSQPDSRKKPNSGTVRQVKRIMVAVAGGTVLAVGVVLIVLPGPAILVIPAGLGILAMEFAWARRWLERVRSLTKRRKG